MDLLHLESDEQLAQLFEVLKSSGKTLVIDFWATWCGPCKAIAPFYEELAKKHGSSLVFAKCDVDKAQDVAEWASIAAMPTFQFYQMGLKGPKKVHELKGANKAALQAAVEKFVKKDPAPSSAPVTDLPVTKEYKI